MTTCSILVICDGLRADLVAPDICPAIVDLAREGTAFLAHRAIFPSATRATCASTATGCRPRRHGLHGNQMVLAIDGVRDVHDVGKPEFRDALAAATGRTLQAPTLAERLAGVGGQIVFSNVSPGAAIFHDPDGHGHVYHRAIAYGPGRRPVADHSPVAHGAQGDRDLTVRFCEDVLARRRPAHAVLWLCEPDLTMHRAPLGSPENRAAIAAADACVALVREAVAARRRDGDDVLFMIGSDHGHETVTGVVPVETRLIEAGFKRGPDDRDVLVATQGTSAYVALAGGAAGRQAEIAAWLAAQAWTAEVAAGPELEAWGLPYGETLSIAFSMARTNEKNAFGVPGASLVASRFEDTTPLLGFGQHGGRGENETHPFLIAVGRGFSPGAACAAGSSMIDIAPTVLAHHTLAFSGLDGTPLQERVALSAASERRNSSVSQAPPVSEKSPAADASPVLAATPV